MEQPLTLPEKKAKLLSLMEELGITANELIPMLGMRYHINFTVPDTPFFRALNDPKMVNFIGEQLSYGVVIIKAE